MLQLLWKIKINTFSDTWFSLDSDQLTKTFDDAVEISVCTPKQASISNMLQHSVLP